MKAKHVIVLIVILFVCIGIYSAQKEASGRNATELSLSAFKKEIGASGEKAVLTEYATGQVLLHDEGSHYITYVNPSESPISELAEKEDVSYRYEVSEPSLFGGSGWWILIYAVLFFFLLSAFSNRNRQPGNGGGQARPKNESKFIHETPNVTLADVGGLNEETKKELRQIIELFQEHDKASALGIKKPKAALLHGPPGTGKTLIAKAIAHELNAFFLAKSASSFMEMYVGVGSSRIREMFQLGRQLATPEKPALIFIDEIDAIAKKRGGRNSHEERENTLNELLKELDGVDTNENVFFICATNLYDSLDEAFKRSGRISNELYIGLPEEKGREEILSIHAKTFELSDEVIARIPDIAQSIRGYSGADIEEMYAKAAKHAFHQKKNHIDLSDIQQAIDRMALGTENHKLTDKDVQKRVAYHEAGHALIQALRFPNTIRKATIIPRGGALGFVAPIPKEIDLATHEELMDKLAMIVAGGIAEREIFGGHSVGVGGDVQQARHLIDAMVDVGLLKDDFQLLYAKDEIEQAKKNLFQEAVERCRGYIRAHQAALHAIANALIQKETLDGTEIQAIVEAK